MTPKNAGGSRDGGLVTPGRLVIAVLSVLALIFIFENTGHAKIRLLIPEISMPLWAALLATAVIGWLCGRFCVRR
ncbi:MULTISPECIES: hypothetical protein [unclassified Streptomyces]|uniref:hypothetical protein n=1 Tax=unclassified Streptomyces TaxID=2593676 RepID=UPI002DDC10BA|nr:MULTISPECIES: hypothetical protein [unclassified Streptomyces]WSA91482.1 hypothetical protein OIE63_07860 [Streptomyces sp. NBC_01795]WSB75854.1 hypothetical protein OHB04_08675 [Streptomyces sp. NBC_01775]WSS15871.1 hypothetical protein OG533_31265 [Streptomyces sp. NBC_01186]WSS44711.1 hypothetical protein OG220_32050 [Streptomyces sp. NBC_01187]